MTPITLVLVPSNGKHVTKKNSQVIRKRGASRFIAQNDTCKAAELDLHRQARAAYPHPPLVSVPCVLDLVFVFATKDRAVWGTPKSTRPDVGNLAALVSDAMQGILYVDDAQVVRETTSKIWGERCEVRVIMSAWG